MKTVSFITANAKNVFLKKWSLASGRVHSRPYQISIEVNERCNARCLMCDCWKEKTDYLTASEIEAVLLELKSGLGEGVFLQISGGEPLIFRDVDRLFRVCREQNLICKISTNGIALNEKICDRIISSGLKYLTVSLDSHIPEIHDKYRGVKGTFDRAVSGLAYLRQNSSMVLGISAIIMKE